MITATSTAVDPSSPVEEAPPGPLSRRIRRGWVLEVLAGVVIYLVYDKFRDEVVGASEAAYLERIGGLGHVHDLPLPVI